MSIKTAFLLCGGKGTRLRPITYEMPKALIPVQGRTLLEHTLDLLKRHDISRVLISVGYLKDMIERHFGDGSKFGVDIMYIEESRPLGTAGPLRLAKDLLKETFIVSNGDELKDIDIGRMEDLHSRNSAAATIALTEAEDPARYGVAVMENDRILKFMEKPKVPPSNLINSGFYVMEPEVLDMVPPGQSSLERDIFPRIAQSGKLFGFPFSGQWFDCGNMERYERALKEWRGIRQR
jgi:NDP-sugar pyrophosphorylase family protein